MSFRHSRSGGTFDHKLPKPIGKVFHEQAALDLFPKCRVGCRNYAPLELALRGLPNPAVFSTSQQIEVRPAGNPGAGRLSHQGKESLCQLRLETPLCLYPPP